MIKSPEKSRLSRVHAGEPYTQKPEKPTATGFGYNFGGKVAECRKQLKEARTSKKV